YIAESSVAVIPDSTGFKRLFYLYNAVPQCPSRSKMEPSLCLSTTDSIISAIAIRAEALDLRARDQFLDQFGDFCKRHVLPVGTYVEYVGSHLCRWQFKAFQDGERRVIDVHEWPPLIGAIKDDFLVDQRFRG